MSSLVADYGSESSDDEDEIVTDGNYGLLAGEGEPDPSSNGSDENSNSPSRSQDNSTSKLLPLPALDQQVPAVSGTAKSVFANPFRLAEEAKKSVLEKHVKMTPSVHELTQSSTGSRQVCWNYRKGRCRFGQKCKYSHNTDLVLNTGVVAEDSVGSQAPADYQMGSGGLDSGLDIEVIASSGKKRRPGLSQSIVPSKKVMKNYQKQLKHEKPWLGSK